MKGILLIFFMSLILALILFSILYVLSETNVVDGIANLVTHEKLK